MFFFLEPYRPPSPEEQAFLNRQFIRKRKAEYEVFCKQLIKSIDTYGISIEHMDDEQKTAGYNYVNFLLEYKSERGFYYNMRFKISVWNLKKIGNPIFNVWDRFIAECKENDPLRIN